MGKMILQTCRLSTPIGELQLISDGQHLLRIDYMSANKPTETQRWAAKHFKDVSIQPGEDGILKNVKQQLFAYFTQERETFDIPFNLLGTTFQKRVWNALFKYVPFGETKTYKDIAEMIQQPKAVRAVGGAVNKNPLSIIVPCHRIVGRNGKLVGYNGGLDKKQYLLDHELKNLFS